MGPETNSAKRVVLSITRMTVHNGPGMRTLILFKGCPLHCLWCSTPESQKSEPEIAVFPDKCIHCNRCVPACPLDAIKLTDKTLSINRSLCNDCGSCATVCYAEAIRILGQPMSIEELLTEVRKDMIFYRHSGGGVTLSGGEPLLDIGFTRELLQVFKEDNINTGIDTCGNVPRVSIEQVLPKVDFFLWDIKHMDAEKHRRLTGVSNELILSNARAVSERGVPIYIRLPLIPGCNDSEENIRATCEFAMVLSSLVQFDLLPLHHLGKARYDSLDRPYPIADFPLISDSVLQDTKRLVESYGLQCTIQA